MSYPAAGRDVKAVFTNVWGAKTTVNLGVARGLTPLTRLIPATTAAAFGVAGVAWLVESGLLKTRRVGFHD